MKEEMPTIGTKIFPWGKVKMVGWTGGERYYWFIKDNSVSMIPWTVVREQIKANKARAK